MGMILWIFHYTFFIILTVFWWITTNSALKKIYKFNLTWNLHNKEILFIIVVRVMAKKEKNQKSEPVKVEKKVKEVKPKKYAKTADAIFRINKSKN